MVKSGTLDLTTTTAGPVKKTFQTTISGTPQNLSQSPASQSQGTTSVPTSSTPQKTYITVDLTLQYSPSDTSLNDVTRIDIEKQGETYYPGYGKVAGYGSAQQLTASFPVTEAGYLYDVYTSSYSSGSKKVGILDLRTATGNVSKTLEVK